MTHAQDVSDQTSAPRSKKIVLLFVALAVVLGLVATGGSFAYAKQFEGKALPGTKVLNHDVSGKTPEEIEALLKGQKTNVKVTVKAGESTTEAPLDDLGVSIDAKETAQRAVARENSVGNLVSAALSGETTVDPAVKVDAKRTKAYVQALVPAEETSAVDAQVIQDEETKEFKVTPAKPGKGIDAEQFTATVQKNAPALKNFTVTQEFTEIQPILSTKAAEETLEKINTMTDSSIVVTGPENKTFKISKKERFDFIDVAPNKAGDNFEITLKQDAIDGYLSSIANEIEVTKKDGVTEVTPDGKKVVVSDKEDGLTITNKKDVSEKVTAAVRDGKDLTIAYETKKEAAKTEEKQVQTPSINPNLPSYAPAEARNGGKWIDVDLRKKTLTAYVGDKVVFGPRAIVDGKAGNETVTGEYRIYQRNEKQDLTNGAYYPKDHPKYYYTPDVPYVQYFHRGFAIHGAPWRSSFGYSGSHGCVNMSVSDARWMWNWAEQGTRVVTHR